MSRLSVVVFVALAAAGVTVWQTEQPTDGNVAGTRAPTDPQHISANVSASSEADTRQATRDTAGPRQANSKNDRLQQPASTPSPDNDSELKAAFEELLADPDPQIRREAERLAREFEGLDAR